MKKQIRLCVAVVAVSATMVACGSEGRVQFLSLGTAGTGGVYYPLGGAIASRLSVADSARQYTAEVSGGSVENVNRLSVGQMDLAMVIARRKTVWGTSMCRSRTCERSHHSTRT
jgi:hypothetical protein